jgi:NTE family protein
VRSGGFRVARYTIRSPISLLRAMYFTALEPHDADYIGAHDAARTIAIDALDVRATDFKLDRARKEALYESGVAAATAFLARWDFERYKAVYRGGGAVPARQAVPLS